MAHGWNKCCPTPVADPMALGELQSPKENMEVQTNSHLKKESNHASGIYQETTHTDLKTVVETALDSNPLGIDFLKDGGCTALTPTKSPLLGDTVPEFDVETNLETPKYDPASTAALLDGYSDVSSCSESDNEGTSNFDEIFDSEQTAETHETLPAKNLNNLEWPSDGDKSITLKPDICKSATLGCKTKKQKVVQDHLQEDQYSNISSPEPDIERETSDLKNEEQDLKQDLCIAPESVSDHALETPNSGDCPLTSDVHEMIKEPNANAVDFHNEGDDVDGNMDILTTANAPKSTDEDPETLPSVPTPGPEENPTSQSPQTEALESGHNDELRKGKDVCQLTSGLEMQHSSFDFLETCLKNSEDGLRSSFNSPQNSEITDVSVCEEPNQTQPEPNNPQGIFEAEQDQIELSEDVTKQEDNFKQSESNLNENETSHLSEVARLIESHDMKKKLDPVVVLDYKEHNDSQVGVYRCAQCSGTAESLDDLIEHHHQHSQLRFQFCHTCGCYLTQLAERHRCGHHELEGAQIFPKAVQHQDTEDSEKLTKAKVTYKCRHCPLLFSKEDGFRIHELKHKNKTPYRCHGCGLYFTQGGSLKRHLRLNRCVGLQSSEKVIPHPMKRMIKTAVKTSDGPLGECYVKLVDIYKRDPVSPSNTCNICNKVFKLRAQYNSHMKTHSSEKPYKCQDCDKVFKYSWNLNRHRREQCDRKEEPSQSPMSYKEQEMEDTEQTNAPSLSTLPTRFKCPLCPRAFKYSYNLVRHLRVQCLKEYTKADGKGKTSSGYKCPLCGVVFTIVCNLARHIKNTCLPLYKTKFSKIKQEMKSEVLGKKSKPKASKKSPPIGAFYKCKLCPAVFSHTSGLFKHSRKHRLSAKTGKPVRYRTANPDDLKVTSDQRQEEKLSCRFCGKRFTESLTLKNHMAQHKGDKPYNCQQCGKRFKKHAYLIAHAQSHKRKVQCSVCNKIFPTIADLLQHRASHDNKGMLKCPDCQMEFRFPVYLLRHMVTHERRDKQEANQAKKATPQPVQEPAKKLKRPIASKEEFRCSLCKKSFADAKALADHCLSHLPGGSSSKCQFCKRHFSSRAALVRHIRIHTGEKPYPCKKCGQYFHRMEPLKAHVEHCNGTKRITETKDTQVTVKTEKKEVKRGLHKVKKQFECQYCPHAFVWASSLTKHLNGHKLKLLVPCSKCGRCYTKPLLDSHERECNGKKSTTVTLFPCKKCGKSFSRIDNAHVHEKKCKDTSLATNVIKKSSQEIGTALKDKLPHKCPHCPKSFKYRSYLLKHLPSHLAEKPYTCMHCGHKYASQRRYLQHEAFCDGIFRRKSMPLQKIMKTEPVVKTSQGGAATADADGQYRCKFCNKNFSKARNLRRHILTHTDVKPYRCKTCDSCFSRYDHLKVHQNRCRGKKQRLEVCVPKISPKHVGTGWQNSVQVKQEEVFQCNTCSKQFSSQINLARHTSLLHTTSKPFSCKRCGSSFSSLSSLKKHTLLVKCKRASLNSATKTVKAKVTEQQCRETAKLLQRIQGHYSNKLKFSCAYCPRQFKSQGQAQVHTRLHTGEKPFGCENCGERFIRRDYLQRHLVKCTSKREASEKTLCERCGQLFPKEALQNHKSKCVVNSREIKKELKTTSSTPPKIKTFSCTNCSEKFLLFSQLQQHFLSTHREDTLQKPYLVSEDVFIKKDPLEEYETSTIQTDNVDDQDNETKPYPCPYCSMRFINNSGLGMHVRTHTTAYPLSCQKCKKGFFKKNVLKKHKCPGKTDIVQSRLSPATEPLTKEKSAVLVFDKGSNTTGTGVLQTQFSCKDGNKKILRKIDQSSGQDSLSDKANKYQCSECDQSFIDGLMLISHLEDHGREDLFKKKPWCKICGKKFEKQHTLSRHMNSLHGVKIPKTSTCQICLKSFRFPSDLENHKACHDPSRPFCCSVCDSRFMTQKSLNQHFTMSHYTVESFTCHPCNKTYATRKSYARHNKLKHAKGVSNSDPDKGSSSSADQFDIEVDVDEESDVSVKDENEASEDDSDSAPYFPCHVCGKTFSTSESLEDHQRCHLGEKPHECEECGKCFFQLVNLQQHQRSHKSEFQCQTCGRGFVSLFALRKHKHSHGKNRPHRCSKCHLSFTGPSQLAEHMATHRDENFPCDLCDRTFSCKITRAEHRKTHSEQEEELPPLIPPSNTPPLTSSSSASSSSPGSGDQMGFKYRCGICKMRFRDPEQLSEHGCKAAKERPYVCPECDKHFLHGSHLKKHQLSHQVSGPYRYQCNQCHMNFTYRHHFLNHLSRHGNEKESGDGDDDGDAVLAKTSDPDNIYQCPICPQSYSQAMELADHLTIHSFTCKVCNMTFPSKTELASHEQCHLTATTQYECTECGESFLGSDAFRQHQCAQRQRLYTENRTGPKLQSPTSLKHSSRAAKTTEEEEEVDVGEDFYNCPDCKKRFSSQADLSEHRKMQPECRPYKCQVCDKRFAKRRYLSKHQLIHERPFRCDTCPQSFDSESSLLSHQRTHADRPFQCTVCHKCYTTAQELLKHEKKHTEFQGTGGAHRCDMCYKSFGHLSLLRKHQESHVGEVVYECTECDKAFAFFHLLEEHQRTHVPDSMSTSPTPQNPDIDQM
ncbi:zinc finger protein 1035 [Sardina pilchardus]|uniref:zinc finger protein 1035 n=1 Tax=Sardina pilchardus TaxID=27697 RepID=UPI002E148241